MSREFWDEGGKDVTENYSVFVVALPQTVVLVLVSPYVWWRQKPR